MPTITIDLTAPQSQRVGAAFGKAYNLGRDATASEVRQFLINYMKAVVTDKERSAAIDAITIADLGVT